MAGAPRREDMGERSGASTGCGMRSTTRPASSAATGSPRRPDDEYEGSAEVVESLRGERMAVAITTSEVEGQIRGGAPTHRPGSHRGRGNPRLAVEGLAVNRPVPGGGGCRRVGFAGQRGELRPAHRSDRWLSC